MEFTDMQGMVTEGPKQAVATIGAKDYHRLKIQISDIENEGELQTVKSELRAKFKACPEFQVFNDRAESLFKMKGIELRIRARLAADNQRHQRLNEVALKEIASLKRRYMKDKSQEDLPAQWAAIRQEKLQRMRVWREEEMELIKTLQKNYLPRSSEV